jgi:hypothetical protein
VIVTMARALSALGSVLLSHRCHPGRTATTSSVRRVDRKRGGAAMPKRLALATTTLWSLLVPALLNAVPIHATFEGTVTTVPTAGSLDQFFMPGDPITVSAWYDSTWADTRPEDALGDYLDSGEVTEIRIGSHSFDPSPGEGRFARILISDDRPPSHGAPGIDSFYGVVGLEAVPFPQPDGPVLLLVEMILSDSTGTVFDDDSLPLNLSLDDFDRREIHFSFLGAVLLGSVTSIHFVPEPTAVTLLLGVLGLGLTRCGGTELGHRRR